MRTTTLAGVVGLGALSACSLVFDPASLGRGAGAGPRAGSDAGDDSTSIGPASGEQPPSSDGVTLDAGGATGVALDAGGVTEPPGRGATAAGPGEGGRPGSDVAGDGSSVAMIDAAPPGVDTDGAAVAMVADASPTASDGEPVVVGVPDVLATDAAAVDTTSLAEGLVAFYPFDETTGTTAADVSGNGHAATMNGATFAPGVNGNAATMNGADQYVSLPAGIVGGLTSFSVSTWVKYVTVAPSMRIFDFGRGANDYMRLTEERFAITVSGPGGEQATNVSGLPAGRWLHVVVTLAGGVSTVYLDGSKLAQNAAVTLTPASLGTTRQNWIGRSQSAGDASFAGQIDQFRIYARALTPAEVTALYAQRE